MDLISSSSEDDNLVEWALEQQATTSEAPLNAGGIRHSESHYSLYDNDPAAAVSPTSTFDRNISDLIIQPMNTPVSEQARSPRIESMPTTVDDVLTRPVLQGRELKCRIIRRKGGVERFYPQYEMFIEELDTSLTFLMSARRRKKSKTSNYVISSARIHSSFQKHSIVAKVRSNFLGTEFSIYQDQVNSSDRLEYGAVMYEPNVLGFKGPRKMTLVLPGMTLQGQRMECRPKGESDTLLGQYKSESKQSILCLYNKFPQWNEETQSFVLNFNGRVTMASVKNFQIVHDHDLDYIIMQFGRDTFSLDIRYPMCPLQAFGIALTSFDAKLACE